MPMDKRNNVHGGHRERLRQRLMAEGADNFEPHELLEFLLYYAIPRQNVNKLAHELLDSFGDLRSVLGAELEELTRVKGMGEHAARWLNLVGRCTDICGQVEPNGFLDMSTAALVVQELRSMNFQPATPCLMQLCLNRKNLLLYRRILSDSRKWGEPEILREGIRDVFSTGARFVVLVLFLDDDPLEPTPYDLQKIEDYAYTLNMADSVLLDLILIQGKQCRSLRRDGHIPDLQLDGKTRRMCEEYLSDFPAEPESDTYYTNYSPGGET